MKSFFELRESQLTEATVELAGVTLQNMEHCPGAVSAFKKNLKDGASPADVAKAAKAVDAYLAIEDKAKTSGATEDDVEKMEELVDKAKSIISELGLEGHDYHDMHLDRVEDMVEDDDDDEEELDESATSGAAAAKMKADRDRKDREERHRKSNSSYNPWKPETADDLHNKWKADWEARRKARETKESVELDGALSEYSLEEIESYMMSEKFANLDEDIKKSVSNFVNKAKNTVGNTRRKVFGLNKREKQAVQRARDERDYRLHKSISDLEKKHKGAFPKKPMTKENVNEVLDTPQAMDSYRNKAKASKERAAKSAVATVLRSKDKETRAHPAKDLKTIAKRTAGEKMADRNAARKFRKATNEEVELDEISRVDYKKHGETFAKLRKQAQTKVDKETAAKYKSTKKESVEDQMPASPDEKSMAMRQAEFIEYVGREIGEHLKANKEFPEWMQNKLSALNEKAKDMHSTLGAHGGTNESGSLPTADKRPEKYIKPDGKPGIRMVPVDKQVIKKP